LSGLVELLGREDRVSHQLLRDGGGALGAAAELAHDGAQDALGVNAVVLVEALVLDVDGALLHVVRDVVERDGAAVLEVVLGYLRAVGGVDDGGLGHEVGVCRLVVGQVLEPRVHDRAQRQGERQREERYETKNAGDAKADGVRTGVLVSPAGSDAHGTSLCGHNRPHYRE
jgi:hypothetical protein